MSACPRCGVAVVPGYVKCPKCGNSLPAVSRTRSGTRGAGGGTVMNERGSSRTLVIAIGAGLAIAIVLVIALTRGGSKPANSETPPPEESTATTQPTPLPTPNDRDPDEPAPAPAQPSRSSATEAEAVAADLDRELKRQRLWGTVSVVDQRIDVRSGSCEDAGMAPVLDAARPQLHGAGLTKLRCLAQSGAVVFERDL